MQNSYGKQPCHLKNRVLNRINIDDAMEADLLFDMLMGEKVEPRRDFIRENAKYVENLDI